MTVDHKRGEWLAGARILPSPNCDDRPEGEEISLIVIHAISLPPREYGGPWIDALFTNTLDSSTHPSFAELEEVRVSAHFLIRRDGELVQYVALGQRAWHAGEAYWAGEHDINSHSIGIELVNPGHEFGYRSFPQEQIDNLITLCKVIIDRYGISQKNILGHSDVAPKRKYDPGELFPWKSLSEKGIGIWPKVLDMDIEAGRDLIIETPDSFHELLCVLGYDPDIEFDSVVMAFHRHFYPEKFITGDYPYIPDNQSAARLLALMRAVHICDA